MPTPTFGEKDWSATNYAILTTSDQKDWHATNGRERLQKNKINEIKIYLTAEMEAVQATLLE